MFQEVRQESLVLNHIGCCCIEAMTIMLKSTLPLFAGVDCQLIFNHLEAVRAAIAIGVARLCPSRIFTLVGLLGVDLAAQGQWTADLVHHVDDLGDRFGRDRFDIGGIGKPGIGHDRGRVGIDQDHPEAFFAQRLAGLSAGIIELASLPDDDGPGADDHDGFDIGSLGHGRISTGTCQAQAGPRAN